MKILVACEYSGRVRDAFLRLGHDAISCDLLDTDVSGPHYKGDVFDIINDGFDLMIAHPPCTHLSTSGARWAVDHWVFGEKYPNGRYWYDGSEKRKAQVEALEFVRRLMNSNIKRIAVENPVSIISSNIRKPDQIIQPWQFGHPENKKTCLWLKGLSPLIETDNVKFKMEGMTEKEKNKIHHAVPGPDRWKIRSTTFLGIARAMAEQWG